MLKSKKFFILFCLPILMLGAFVSAQEVEYPEIPGAETITATTTLTQYINYIFNAALWIVGILALVVIVWGGVQLMVAGGSPGQRREAKSRILYAIIGLLLLLGSWLILNLINPELTILKMPGLELIPPSEEKEKPPEAPKIEISKEELFGTFIAEAIILERESAETMREMVSLSKDCKCDWCDTCIAGTYVCGEGGCWCEPCECSCQGMGPSQLCPSGISGAWNKTLSSAKRIEKNAISLEETLERGRKSIKGPDKNGYLFDYRTLCCPPSIKDCPGEECNLDYIIAFIFACGHLTGEEEFFDCEPIPIPTEGDVIKEAIKAEREAAERIRKLSKLIEPCHCGDPCKCRCSPECGYCYCPGWPCNPELREIISKARNLANRMEENANNLENFREKIIECVREEKEGRAIIHYCPLEQGQGCPEACQKDARECEPFDFYCVRLQPAPQPNSI